MRVYLAMCMKIKGLENRFLESLAMLLKNQQLNCVSRICF